MPKPPAHLSKAAKVRIYNAKNYLRRLIAAGKLDQARAYASAQGLALQTGGEGVGQPATPRNDKRSTPPPEIPLKDSHLASNASLAGSPTLDSFSPTQAASRLVEAYGVETPKRGGPVMRISDKGIVHQRIAYLWHPFAQRLARNKASSVMSWPEYEALQEELGKVGAVASIVQEVTVAGTANPGAPDLREGDPFGTEKAVVFKEVPNRFMRMVTLPNGDEAVAWVANSRFTPRVGQPVDVVPNDDERGGYLVVGEYGRQGGRVR